MSNLTNEPPENPQQVLKTLQLYIDKSYAKGDKELIKRLLSNCKLSIVKTGEWGKRWGYAEAKGLITVSAETLELVTKPTSNNLAASLDMVLQGTDCGLEITSVEFVPGQISVSDVESDLNQIIIENSNIAANLAIPHDLIEKGKLMSEIYLYIYFVENCLRLFIRNVQQSNTLTFPVQVQSSIDKNKANEAQSKFLPLRGDSDLYYCDFVQLQQIISNNWNIFRVYFPQQDQHWLRVKIEDMYRVRNLIAHCGYVTKEELQMVQSNFRMILKQLQFIS